MCYVSSVENYDAIYSRPKDIPNQLAVFYAPIYKTTNNTIAQWKLGDVYMASHDTITDRFRNSEKLVNTLKSVFIVSEPPFSYSYTISGGYINITSNDLKVTKLQWGSEETYSMNMGYWVSNKNPANTLRTFPKYGNLKNNITESKLLMYPYSYVQLIDGQGNSFDIKNEYLDDTQINVRTFTSGGLNSKQAHIVEHYRYKGITLNYCRWELGNGVINNFPNNLTIVDDYSSAYLQGNANQINQSVNATLNQSQLNNIMAQNTARASQSASLVRGVGDTIGGGIAQPLVGAGNGIKSLGDYAATIITSEQQVENTELQGNLTSENAIKSALAKKQDAKNVADNVSLQGGDVYFTFQNQYNGYCLVYKQISDEYIRVLEDYFKKYGYAYNRIETPLLRTRKSWDYIRCIDANITGNINDNSLEKIKTIFNQGVTIWHTTDVGNYSLNNDERT